MRQELAPITPNLNLSVMWCSSCSPAQLSKVNTFTYDLVDKMRKSLRELTTQADKETTPERKNGLMQVRGVGGAFGRSALRSVVEQPCLHTRAAPLTAPAASLLSLSAHP